MPKRKLDDLWGVESLSDVEVEVEGKTFPLSKLCLSLHSTFFRTKFASPEWSDKGDKGRMDLGDVPGGAAAFEVAARFCYDMEDALESADLMFLPEVMCLAEYLGMAEGNSSLMRRAIGCLKVRFEEAQSKVEAAADGDDDASEDSDSNGLILTESAAADEAICAVIDLAHKVLHDPRIKNAVEQSEEMKKVLRPKKIAPRLAAALSPPLSTGVATGAITSRVVSPRDIQNRDLRGRQMVHGVLFSLNYQVRKNEGSDDKQYGLYLVVDGSDHAKEDGSWEVKVSFELRGLSPKGEVVRSSTADINELKTFLKGTDWGWKSLFTEEDLQKMVDSKGGITVHATFTVLEINGRAVVPGESFA
mmetsp:Transcript_25590/g.81181  ORF Transcript_25590/g.81181 Transcript_25590/m.81181 type:complete len:361 (+) Transcript_25590:200-1282(+)